ncbi:LysM domain-containing protein [Bryocella elongata]|uniref:LysM domain-containing protein n=1 Tax=Bryocella elongata TaxID=863522 RepID=A0A1H6A9T6_9BACT|nr:LysM peptidoglycan-binding domain-containing protein [Bryocella elongata]SEG45503.1 LysM domain-containing protein [Bryocella elongata]
MADLDTLKAKYQPVLDTIDSFSEFGAKVDDVSLDGDKLVIKGEVPSKVIANRVWDVIKECDPTFADLEHQIATTGGDDQPYTIKSGDNLSKVSKLFYGSANHYTTIAEHNGIDNPDHIQVGQEINVPPLD